MANYVSNGEISGPIYLADLKPDGDLGGVKFSYQYGMFYLPVSQELPITLPPPYQISDA
jgi:hypothetical protein